MLRRRLHLEAQAVLSVLRKRPLAPGPMGVQAVLARCRRVALTLGLSANGLQRWARANAIHNDIMYPSELGYERICM